MAHNATLAAVCRQVEGIIAEINTISGSEFPYRHSSEALSELRTAFEEHYRQLLIIDDSTHIGVINSQISAVSSSIVRVADTIGFLLRSTSSRNAFELWGPLFRIAKTFLGDKVKIIISSEWAFSPFTVSNIKELPGYVLIGFPATESNNPLILPLAGHELAHNVWQAQDIEAGFRKSLTGEIALKVENSWDEFSLKFSEAAGKSKNDISTDIFLMRAWKPALEFASLQIEEVFCDFLGLFIFGESYIEALSYLLAPFRNGKRSVRYPNSVDRAMHLDYAAKELGINVPSDYIGRFKDLNERYHKDTREAFLLKLADDARKLAIERIFLEAKQVAELAGYRRVEESEIESCLENFRYMIPAESVSSLAVIFAAAWRAQLAAPFFNIAWQETSKAGLIADLVLKSVEVFEFEQRLAAA